MMQNYHLMQNSALSDKANRILKLVLFALLLILIRVWYLSVIQQDAHKEEAYAPQRRSSIELIDRATILDRFNIPLATNKIEYQAAILYAPIRQIPAKIWSLNEKGEKVRLSERVDYISRLSRFLGEELELDPLEIEDQIYARAALFPHLPCLIKSAICEKTYYKLKMAEREWPGLAMQHIAKRVYPKGKIGADIIGYMGAISKKEFHAIATQIRELQTYLEERQEGAFPFLPKGFDSPIQVKERLCELQEKAYKINDSIGKTGVEKIFDEELRGFYGEKVCEVSRNGTLVKELPCSRPAIPGKRVLLTISSELQEYAEKLLIESEQARGPKGEDPWIKGGAIVAMIPQTGEVVALASHPRFDPNDFIGQKSDNCLRWLENDSFIARIWEGRETLKREMWKKGEIVEESLPLTWNLFLSRILSPHSSIASAMSQIQTIQRAIHLQEEPSDPLLLGIRIKEDQLLLLDLLGLLIKKESFSKKILEKFGTTSLSDYFATSQAVHTLEAALFPKIRNLFHSLSFAEWRENDFKNFLKEKRKEEKENKSYAHPYTDYLIQEEKRQFRQFWEKNRHTLLLLYLKQTIEVPNELQPYIPFLYALDLGKKKMEAVLQTLGQLDTAYLETMRSFEQLDRPLLGNYRNLRGSGKCQLEKDLAAGFYPLSGYGHGRSLAYRAAAPQGSVFKLVTAYQALLERFQSLKEEVTAENLNPLTLIDNLRSSHPSEQVLGSRLSGEPIYRNYKGGKLPRSSHSNIGKIDLIGALEQSSNIYFSILAGECVQYPADLAKSARHFGFGKKTGIALPAETSGTIPDDLQENRTGLYSYAIGQHSLTVTPLQTARMLATIANGGEVLKPEIVRMIAGKEPLKGRPFLPSLAFPFKRELSSIGIFFPLFTETDKNREQQTSLFEPKKEVLEHIFLPDAIRNILIEGMRKTVTGEKGTARASLIRSLPINPRFITDYIQLTPRLIGKTGTAQILYKSTIDAETKAVIRDHVWFGGIAFSETTREPELVVVVYLPFGFAGKEAAPLAAQIVKKWEEITIKQVGL